MHFCTLIVSIVTRLSITLNMNLKCSVLVCDTFEIYQMRRLNFAYYVIYTYTSVLFLPAWIIDVIIVICNACLISVDRWVI
jgi:hypothetical protein